MIASLNGFRVIYNNLVLNALQINYMDFGEIRADNGNGSIEKPDIIGILAINGDGNIVKIEDEAWKFQFIPIITEQQGGSRNNKQEAAL